MQSDPVFELESAGTVRPWPCDIALKMLQSGADLFVAVPTTAGFLCILNSRLGTYLYSGSICKDSSEIRSIDSTICGEGSDGVPLWVRAKVTVEEVQLVQDCLNNGRIQFAKATVSFRELISAMLNESHVAYEPKENVVCTWYGGALLYADSGGMDKLIGAVCAARPDIAAQQTAIEMSTRVTNSLVDLAKNEAPHRHNRMRV